MITRREFYFRFVLEKATNPFLRCGECDDFLKLKKSWAKFTAEHGLK